MTDTGRVPGEGLPENARLVEQPGAPAHGAYTYLSESTAEDEDLLLLPGAQSAWGNEVAPPAPEPVETVVETVAEAVHEPGPHEISGRDSGSVDLTGVRLPGPAAPAQPAPRRPLHLGPPIPDASASPVRSLADRGPAGAPVRHPGPPASGPEYLDVAPLHDLPPQGAAPWGAPVAAPAAASVAAPVAAPVAAQPVAPAVAPAQGPMTSGEVAPGEVALGAVAAETVVPVPEATTTAVPGTPEPEPVSAAQAVVARVATEAIAAYAGPGGAVPTTPVAQAPATVTGGPEPVPVTSGVVDPGQLLGAALIAEGEQDIADEALETGADAGGGVPSPAGEEQFEAAVPEAPEQAAVAEAPPVEQVVVEQAAEVIPAEAAQVPEASLAEAAPPAGALAPEPAVVPPVVSEAPAPEVAPVAEPAEVSVTPVPDVVPEAPTPAPEIVGRLPEQPAEVPEPIAPVQEAPADELPAPAVTAPEAVQPVEPEATPAEVPEAETQVEVEVEVGTEPEVEQEAAEVVAEPLAASAEAVAVAPVEAVEPVVPVAPEADVQPEPQAAPVARQVPPVSHIADIPAQVTTQQTEPSPEPPTTEASPEPSLETPAEALAEASTEAPAEPLVEAPVERTVEAPDPSAAVDASPAVADTQPAPAPVFVPAPVPAAPQPDQPADEPVAAPMAEFVQVEGMVPITPHLAPTPPHPLVLPTQGEQPAEAPTDQTDQTDQTGEPNHSDQSDRMEHQATPQAAPAAVTVPAPRAADPAPAPATPDPEPPAASDPDPEVAQSPEDLETRAADQEESPAVEELRESTGPAAPAYDDAEREAILRVMRERRDIRNGFRGDPIPHEVLLRVLEAAHTAPSVGHSQPWDFVVIRSAETRRAMHELAMRQRDAYAKSLPKGRAKQFKELKIEAILDTPVNIVVTADPTRGGRHTLGRHTQPQMAPYSSALAVENLWLAARAEGLGVGWVSFFDEREMVRALGLPEHLDVVAYLCVGYVDEFPDEPELMQAGWAKRRPLSWVVHEETYGRRALPGEDPHDLLSETVAGIRPLDAKALGEAWERQKRMTKPAGALGMLEIISAQLSGLSRQCPPPIPEPAAVAIFAGDHGVHAQGVTPWPQEVTAQMVANFLGGGAVCNAFATQVGAEVCVVDVGVAADLPATPGLLPRKVRAGTSDMTTGPAMTREEAKQAIEVGIETARDLVAAGNKALLTGEMGIANTTASAALISVFTGADPAEVTGRGTGINDETLARKTEVVRRALELHQPDPADPIGVLAAIGGFEHAAIVGLLLGGASLRTPVILDGVSAGAAALVARAIAPEVLAACIAGHRSAEPGHVAALNKLGLRPLVDLDLRLGEGTGALLALPLVQSTARAMHEVATFDSAGVTEK